MTANEPESGDDLPEWLPDEYDVDAPLRERLPIMAEIEGRIELWVGDDRGIVEIVHQPLDLSENHAGTYTLKTGTGSDLTDGWDYEIVVPKPENGDARLLSVDPNQEIDAYQRTKERELSDVDVRIYGVDHDRLHVEVPV